jgi:hypothetical protein
MPLAEEIKTLTRIAVTLEKIAGNLDKIAGDGITMRHDKPGPDGRDDDAISFIKANPSLTVENTEAGLAAVGIARGRKWVRQTKMQLGLPVGRRPVALKTEKPFNHRGLKMRKDDYHLCEYPDEKAMSAADVQKREAFAIEAIKQNRDADIVDLWSYIREHRQCGLHRPEEWINSHRPA